MKLSVVALLPPEPLYPRDLFDRLSRAARRISEEFEVVWVSDGAREGVPAEVLELCRREPRLRVVDLSRSFGDAKALLTGMAHTDGDLVFLADGRLEEPPETLEAMWKTMQASGADVVHGVAATPRGGWRQRFWDKALRELLGQPVADPTVTLRLMTRRFVVSLLDHRDREVFLPGLMATAGFVQVACPVEAGSFLGSGFARGKSLGGLVDAVTAFSIRPLTAIFYLGCGILLLAAAAAVYLVIRWQFLGGFLAGWASLMVSIWLLGGLTIFCLGLLGIYLSKVFMETKRRPYTVVRAVYERSGRGEGE